MTLIISVDGVDITDDVMIEDARFTMASGPSPGDFEFRVKDAAKTYDFRAAQTCDVDFQGVRVFEGFVFYAVMGHAFPADDTVTNGPSPVERIWTLRGSDLNVLFRKRVIFDQDSPSSPIALNLAAGTSDLTYLNAIVDHLTLVDDNLTFDFNAVGTPNPDRAGIAISIGDSWERVMALTAEIPGAVWGIRPPRTVYYEDNDTETAPFAISDTPDDVTSFGYSNFDWLNDGSHLVNDAKIWGVGLGQNHLTYVNVRDEASIATHGRWENPNAWRYNLYLNTSVTLVANSIVYGSPQNLHGAKDDAIVVTCRIRKPGIMPGDKVRIISSIFGEEIVLPVRRYTISFVNRNDALFDLELTWDIDQPRSLFDYPPFTMPQIVIPDISVPICDDLNFATGWIDSTFDWEVVKNHPWLGSSGFSGNLITMRSKKRYNQTFGIILIADYGDGVAGSYNYWHGRHYIVQPARWAIQIDFTMPYYSMVPGTHQAPFPDFVAGLWWGGDSLDIYPSISLEIEAFGTVKRILGCAGGINNVAATGYFDTHVPQGSRWHYELYSNGASRCWPHGGVRPAGTTTASATITGPVITTEPWRQNDFGPNRPWRKALSDGTDSYEHANYIYLRAQATGSSGGKSANPGSVLGNPTASNSGIRDAFLNFTTGPTVGGTTSGYHEDLKDGFTVSIPINDFRFVTLPDSFNFSTEVPINCVESLPAPVSGAMNCELITKTGDASYITTWPFAEGSTVCTLEGVNQRLNIDYTEDVESHTITFREPVLSSASLYVCYRMMSG